MADSAKCNMSKEEIMAGKLSGDVATATVKIPKRSLDFIRKTLRDGPLEDCGVSAELFKGSWPLSAGVEFFLNLFNSDFDSNRPYVYTGLTVVDTGTRQKVVATIRTLRELPDTILLDDPALRCVLPAYVIGIEEEI